MDYKRHAKTFHHMVQIFRNIQRRMREIEPAF